MPEIIITIAAKELDHEQLDEVRYTIEKVASLLANSKPPSLNEVMANALTGTLPEMRTPTMVMKATYDYMRGNRG